VIVVHDDERSGERELLLRTMRATTGQRQVM